MNKTIYVLDTSVLIYSPESIYSFENNDIYLPLVVIDELDSQKSKPGNLGYSAREAFRILDRFNLKELVNLDEGANLPNEGKLFIYNPRNPFHKDALPLSLNDNLIINAGLSLKNKFKDRRVVIVTMDKGLQVRAMAEGCESEKYRHDEVKDNYSGFLEIEVESNDEWLFLMSVKSGESFNFSNFPQRLLDLFSGSIFPNQFVIFTWGETHKCITMYQNGVLRRITNKASESDFMGLKPKNLEQTCALELLNDDTIPLVTISGSAGGGKSILSIAAALEKIDKTVYDKIIYIKPAISVGGNDIGFLPGDKMEKLYSWAGPLIDNIEQLLIKNKKNGKTTASSFEELYESGIIELENLGFIQGRSIPNSVIILDEAQNCSPLEIRMLISRCAKNSKVILLGDISQIESKYLDSRSNGLAHVISGAKRFELTGHITLRKVERSPLAAISNDIFCRIN